MQILMAGLPGSMASLVAQMIVDGDSDLELMPFALSGETHGGEEWRYGEVVVDLIPPERHKNYLASLSRLPDVIAVDFSRAAATEENVGLYILRNIPFIMGTTGGDPIAMASLVQNSNICAVIAPNMDPALVTVQSMFEWVAEQFPGSLSGFELSVKESHQAAKEGVSGTARAMAILFSKLGVSFPGGINSIRDPNVQLELGIRNLTGHGYHWYTVVSADGSVRIELSTQAEGRDGYSRGTIRAIRFLQDALGRGYRGRIYSMVDVLRGWSD